MRLPVFSEFTIRSIATPASFFKGEKYYQDGAVGVVETDGERYWAKVQGTRPYRVTIYERADELHADCTCPYNFGGICKHAVAAMLKVLHEGPTWSNDPRLSPERMIKRMSKPELESFVLDLIDRKEGILDLLRSRYTGRDASLTMADYRSKVEEAFEDEDLSVYNTRNVYERVKPVEDLAERLEDQGNYSEAAKVFEGLFEGIARNLHRVEDSYGLFGEIAGHALESMVECLLRSDLTGEERRHYVGKFWKSYERVRYQHFNDHYRQALLSLASEDDLVELCGRLDALMDAYGYGQDDDIPSIRYYRHAVSFKLDVLEALGRSAEFIALANANCDVSEVCLKLAVKLKRDGNAGAALESAERCVAKFSDAEAEDLKRFLAEAYEERGEDARAAKKYYELLLSSGNFEYYGRLRRAAIKGGTWPVLFSSVRANIGLRTGSRERSLTEVYLSEAMYDEAIKVARGSTDLTVLEMVAEGVKDSYPEEAYELYRRLIDLYLDQSIGRASYRQAVGFLSRMKRIGFDDEFGAYVDELYRRFSRRPALLDEMSKISA